MREYKPERGALQNRTIVFGILDTKNSMQVHLMIHFLGMRAYLNLFLESGVLSSEISCLGQQRIIYECLTSMQATIYVGTGRN